MEASYQILTPALIHLGGGGGGSLVCPLDRRQYGLSECVNPLIGRNDRKKPRVTYIKISFSSWRIIYGLF
jgi:hypothetical protein